MPMMQIGKMRMAMSDFLMFMDMGMASGNHTEGMLMRMVMIIMTVPVDVLTADVCVSMGMFLKNERYNRSGQNQGSNNLNPGQMLRKQ